MHEHVQRRCGYNTMGPADFETTTEEILFAVSISEGAHDIFYRGEAGQGKHLVSFSSTNFALVKKFTASHFVNEKAFLKTVVIFKCKFISGAFKCASTLKSSIISRARARISQGKTEYSGSEKSIMEEPPQYHFLFHLSLSVSEHVGLGSYIPFPSSSYLRLFRNISIETDWLWPKKSDMFSNWSAMTQLLIFLFPKKKIVSTLYSRVILFSPHTSLLNRE